MADGLAFHYLPGNSPLHQWDARCKLPGFLIASMALMHAGKAPLLVSTALLAAAAVMVRLPLRRLFREVRGWLCLLGVIFVFQAMSNSGSAPRLIAWLPASANSIEAATLLCFRLGLVLACATLFTMVTRPDELRNALVWFLSPMPFIPARRVALMMGLTIRLLPLLLDEAAEVRTAARSRLAGRQRNPLRRIRQTVLPIFRRSILRTDELALALAARGYREDIPVAFSALPARHVSVLVLLMLACVGCFV